MPSSDPPARDSAYKPGLAALAAVAVAWAFLLVTLGAFTTSINAGMIFPDWPLSNGSLNPRGWLSNIQMFAEHSHRLSAGVISILTVILAIWIWRRESRRWLRRLGVFAVCLVLAQAVLGGLRVLFDNEAIAAVHACVAQAFVCTLIAIAAACSRGWIERPSPVASGLRRLGVICCVLLFIQLGIAAAMRHSNAGLAIPFFPWSGPNHRLLPEAWNIRVGLNFAHRGMALVLVVFLLAFAASTWRDRGATLGMRSAASLLVGLLALQVLLGAFIIRTYRDPAVTTGHVVCGALTLATGFWLAWRAHRDPVEAR